MSAKTFYNNRMRTYLGKKLIVAIILVMARLTEAGLDPESAKVFISSASEASVFQSNQIYESLAVGGRGAEKLKVIKSEDGQFECGEDSCKLTIIPKSSSMAGQSLYFKGKLAEKLMRKLNVESEERMGGLTKSIGNLTCSSTMSFPKKYACRLDRMLPASK